VVCGVAAGPCDVAATCSGSAGACPPNGTLPDSDGDGQCDAIDVCTDIGGGQLFVADHPKPTLMVGKINSETKPGNDTFKLTGEFVIHGGPLFSSVDPVGNGARVVVQNGAGAARIDQVLPGGQYAGHRTRGWKLSKNHQTWTYQDTTSTPLSGIVRLVIIDRGHTSKQVVPGRVQVKLTGSKGTYPVVAGDEPLKGVVVLGGQVQAEAGYCGETAFGNCVFNGKGTSVTCKP
jgi:hypothetical protein